MKGQDLTILKKFLFIGLKVAKNGYLFIYSLVILFIRQLQSKNNFLGECIFRTKKIYSDFLRAGTEEF